MGAKHQAGDVVGRWRLLEKVPGAWLCQCACGTVKRVDAYSINRGASTSCGCYRSENLTATRSTHGKSRTRLYRVWAAMLDRCRNPNDKHFADYGGRGIVVCLRWEKDFAAFAADMGERPGPQFMLDRVNNDGPYSPDNCRWASPTEQARNRRGVRLISFNGENLTIAEWADRLGLSVSMLKTRISRRKMPVEEAFTAPSRYRERKKS